MMGTIKRLMRYKHSRFFVHVSFVGSCFDVKWCWGDTKKCPIIYDLYLLIFIFPHFSPFKKLKHQHGQIQDPIRL